MHRRTLRYVTLVACTMLLLSAAPATAFGITATSQRLITITAEQRLATSEAGSTATYQIALTRAPAADVTVSAWTDDQLDVSPATLTFTLADWSQPRTLTVTARDDRIAEGDHGAVIRHLVSGPGTTGMLLDPSQLRVSIADNDHAGVVLVQTGQDTSVREGTAHDSYTVRLTAALRRPATVTIVHGTRVRLSRTELHFDRSNWNRPQRVVVQAVDDRLAQGSTTERLVHELVTVDEQYAAVVASSLTVTVVDDESPLIIRHSRGGTRVTENGRIGMYTVVLASQPGSVVTVRMRSNRQVKTPVRTLTFTPENWMVPQAVRVVAIDDNRREKRLHRGHVDHRVVSRDSGFNGARGSIRPQITDNDA